MHNRENIARSEDDAISKGAVSSVSNLIRFLELTWLITYKAGQRGHMK